MGVHTSTYISRKAVFLPLTICISPSLKAYIRSNQTMGWGEKAIEIRSVETGHLDGVFMHKRAQRLKFLCERNDKVMLPYVIGFLSSLYCLLAMVYFPWSLVMNCNLIDLEVN